MQRTHREPERADTLLLGGSYTNEDRLSVTDGAAWVLDGTSGFSTRSVTAHPETDGVWFVETVDQYLHELIDSEKPINEIVARVIDQVVDDLCTEIEIESMIGQTTEEDPLENTVGIHELPAATISLVRWDDTTLEYYSLGDATVLVTTVEQTDRHIEGGPQAIDEALCATVEEYVDSNPDATAEEIRSMLRPHIAKTRGYREVPGGFWCLGTNPASADRGVSGRYPIEDLEYVSLFSDGLLDIVDRFDLFADWDAVNACMHNRGPEAVAERLRAVERSDRSLQQYPRLKPMDDIAAVHLQF